ncbi:hypothetical protein K438DRAFT_1777804 [Mycena galopus ATCC 62051]|nr:hypothetical protein K438DRAFT_1777804 [Mycena galopus ATCC 62051]
MKDSGRETDAKGGGSGQEQEQQSNGSRLKGPKPRHGVELLRAGEEMTAKPWRNLARRAQVVPQRILALLAADEDKWHRPARMRRMPLARLRILHLLWVPMVGGEEDVPRLVARGSDGPNVVYCIIWEEMHTKNAQDNQCGVAGERISTRCSGQTDPNPKGLTK